MSKKRVGFAVCGSFCTLAKTMEVIKALTANGLDVSPIFSEAVYETDTRFGKAADWIEQAEWLCGKPVLHTLQEAEPIGPKGLFDALIVAPCTGNTLAKLANGITDSVVTMACKAHLRNENPLLLAVSTNDGLAGNLKNIGALLVRKHVYFVPFGQDDPYTKPASLIADMETVYPALLEALQGRQIQPVFCK